MGETARRRRCWLDTAGMAELAEPARPVRVRCRCGESSQYEDGVEPEAPAPAHDDQPCVEAGLDTADVTADYNSRHGRGEKVLDRRPQDTISLFCHDTLRHAGSIYRAPFPFRVGDDLFRCAR